MFHNIFSRKKEKIKEKPRILADIHEKNSMVIAELNSADEASIELASLKIGDYLIGECVIERKTSGDFISSMINRRLIEQLRQMQQYQSKLLIIEGDFEELYRFGNPNAIRGFILSLTLNYQIPLIFTKNPKDTARYLLTLAKQQLKPKTQVSFHSRIPKTPAEQKQYILESFPGIGPATAKKLLGEFKTLGRVFNATEQELDKTLKNKAESFKRLLQE